MPESSGQVSGVEFVPHNIGANTSKYVVSPQYPVSTPVSMHRSLLKEQGFRKLHGGLMPMALHAARMLSSVIVPTTGMR